MVKNLLKKKEGFTLIEIVLVLAIAGLIMVIVFLAVSGAQRSRRDTQRKNDIGRISALIEDYASNHNGTYFNVLGWAAWAPTNIGSGNSNNLADPSKGSYTPIGWTATPAVGSVSYRLGNSCDNTAGPRLYSVNTGLESGDVACRDNK